MSVNPRFFDENFEVVGNLIIHAFDRAIRRDNPRRVQLGMLMPGQCDAIELGSLYQLWLQINHRIFGRIAQECLDGQNAASLSSKVTDTTSFEDMVRLIEDCSSIPGSFLIPNFEYIESIRAHCHNSDTLYAPKHYTVGIAFLIGRLNQRRLREGRQERCTHWEEHVLEIVPGKLIRLVDRQKHHYASLPESDVAIWANIMVVE